MTARRTITQIADLDDSSIASPADGDLLQYDADSSKWKNIPGGFVSVLPAASGGDDAPAINAILMDAVGLVVGRPGESYLLGSPIVLYSHTTLDMTGCDIALLASADQCNAVQNAAYATTARGVIDGAMTSGEATLTSATASFTSDDVGKAVTVDRAGASAVPLVSTISSVTDSSTVTLADNAGETVTAAYVAIGPRDTDITVRGGSWSRDAQASSPDDNTRHNMAFHRVDGLTIEHLEYTSTVGKFTFLLGDVTRFRVTDIFLNDTFSDGCHVNAPAKDGYIARLYGSTGDNTVALMTDDFTQNRSTTGSISDVLVEEITAVTTDLPQMIISTDSAFGSIDNVEFRDCKAAEGLLTLQAASSGTISVGRVRVFGCKGGISVGTSSSTGTVESLIVRGSSYVPWSGSASGLVNVGSALTIGNIDVEGADCTTSVQSGGHIIYVAAAATITRIRLAGFKLVGTAAQAVNVADAATVTDIEISDGLVNNTGSSGGVIDCQKSTATLSHIKISNVHVEKAGNFASVKCPFKMSLSNVSINSSSVSFGINTGNSTATTIRGHGVDIAKTSSIGTGTSVHVICPEFQVDVSLLAVANGDMAYNTNADLGCGVGVAISDGTNWKNLYTGSATT